MPAYALAHLQGLRFGPDIAAYLQVIDTTLATCGGRFLVHGSSAEALEGPFSGDVVVVAFRTGLRPARGMRRRPTKRSCRSEPTTPAAGWC